MELEALPPDEARAIYRDLLQIRRFEELCVEKYREGKIRGFLHVCIGQEAIAVGVGRGLGAGDNVVSTYRDHGHALARQVSPKAILAEMYGKKTGCSGGRGGSMHLFDVSHRFFGGNAIVGGGIPLAVGLALADAQRRESRVTACLFGDGAMAEGVCFEAFNLAALWRLPVLFVCENNHYAMGTALERYQANVDLVAKAEAQGVRGQRVDGMDVLAVREATRVALATLRDKRTPVFLECETYRFRAHSMYDPELYRAKEEVAQWRSRDPLLLFENAVQGRGLLSKEELSSIATEVTRELEEAAAFADDAPYEPPEQLHRGLVSTAQEDS